MNVTPLSNPPLSAAERFFWRALCPHFEGEELLEQAFSLAAAEQLAMRAGAIFTWAEDWYEEIGGWMYVLTLDLSDFKTSIVLGVLDDDNEMRVAEAQLARREAAALLRHLDRDPGDEQPLAEWERELLHAAA